MKQLNITESEKKEILRKYNLMEEIPDDYQANFTAKDFMNYIESEWDLEMLYMIKNIVQARINDIGGLIDAANRKEIKGFRK